MGEVQQLVAFKRIKVDQHLGNVGKPGLGWECMLASHPTPSAKASASPSALCARVHSQFSGDFLLSQTDLVTGEVRDLESQVHQRTHLHLNSVVLAGFSLEAAYTGVSECRTVNLAALGLDRVDMEGLPQVSAGAIVGMRTESLGVLKQVGDVFDHLVEKNAHAFDLVLARLDEDGFGSRGEAAGEVLNVCELRAE